MKYRLSESLVGAVVMSFFFSNVYAMQYQQCNKQQAVNSLVEYVTSQQVIGNALDVMQMTSKLLQNQQAKQGAQRIIDKLTGLSRDLQNNPQQTAQKICGIMQMVYPIWPDPELKPMDMLFEARKLLQNPQRNPSAIRSIITSASMLLAELGERRGLDLIASIFAQRQQINNILNTIKQAKSETTEVVSK